jgi:hypothetical protein
VNPERSHAYLCQWQNLRPPKTQNVGNRMEMHLGALKPQEEIFF